MPGSGTAVPPEVEVEVEPVLPPEVDVVPPEVDVVPPEVDVVPPEVDVVPPEVDVVPPEVDDVVPPHELEVDEDVDELDDDELAPQEEPPELLVLDDPPELVQPPEVDELPPANAGVAASNPARTVATVAMCFIGLPLLWWPGFIGRVFVWLTHNKAQAMPIE